MTDKPALTCLNCNRSENDMPLISLQYSGKDAWICSQCMPQLIHHPELLTDKLARAASN
jgi:hypothetical protein